MNSSSRFACMMAIMFALASVSPAMAQGPGKSRRGPDQQGGPDRGMMQPGPERPDAHRPSGPQPGGMRPGDGMLRLDPQQEERMVYRLADDMNSHLRLNRSQYRKVVNYYRQELQARHELERKLERYRYNAPARDREIRRHVEKFDRKLASILNPAQYRKWLDMHPLGYDPFRY